VSYVTREQLVTRFGADRLRDLTDHIGSGSIDDDVLTQAIGLVEGEIDAALTMRYTLPLETVPSLLVGIAGDLVLVRLHVDTASEPVLAAAKQARATLAQIRNGDLALGLPSVLATATTSPISAVTGVNTLARAITDYLG
jgi:phage gp36-like protein